MLCSARVQPQMLRDLPGTFKHMNGDAKDFGNRSILRVSSSFMQCVREVAYARGLVKRYAEWSRVIRIRYIFTASINECAHSFGGFSFVLQAALLGIAFL